MVAHLLILEGLPPDTTEDELTGYLTDKGRIPKEGLHIKYKPSASSAKAIYHIRRIFAEELLTAGYLNIREFHVTVTDGKPKTKTVPPHQPNTSHPTIESQTSDTPSQNESSKTPDTPPQVWPRQASAPGTCTYQPGPKRQLRDPHSQSGSKPSSPAPASSPATLQGTTRSAINITKPDVIAYYTSQRGENVHLNRHRRKHKVTIDVVPGVTKCRLVAQNFTLYIVRAEISEFKCDAFITTKYSQEGASKNTRCVDMDLTDWTDGRHGELRDLKTKLMTILNGCWCNGLRSVAIPVLGAGTHGYPLKLSIATISEAIQEFFAINQHCKMHVYLIDHDQWVVEIIYKMLRQIFGGLIDCFPDSHEFNCSTDYDRVRLKGDNTLETLSGVRVQLVKGDIATIQSDAIVNSIAKDVKFLREGALSKHLVKVGGENFKKQRENLSVEPGYIAITTGGKLNCKLVFHGNCKKWDGATGISQTLLCDVIVACLKAADLQKFDSISFPALGTGQLDTPPDIAAKIMLTEIINYLNREQDTSLTVVKIVILNKKDVLKAFKDEFDNRNRPNGMEQNAPVKLNKYKTNKPKKKCVVNINGIMNDLKVKIKIGDITKNKHAVNVIVNGSNGQLGLEGDIGKALQDVGGKEFVADCKKLGEIPHILRFSPSGNLNCYEVLHVDLTALEKINDWKKAIMACLLETEMKAYTSITFPLLGTGETSALSQDDLAEIFMQTFTEFAMVGHRHLQTIRVVEYTKTGAGGFQDKIDNYFKRRHWMYSWVNFASKNVVEPLKGALWDQFHSTEIQDGKIPNDGALAVNADHFEKRNTTDFDKCRGMTLWIEGEQHNIESAINEIKEEINIGNTTIPGARRQQVVKGAVNTKPDPTREDDVDIPTFNTVLKDIDENQQNNEPRIDQGQAVPSAPPRRRRIMVPDDATDQDIEQLKIQHGFQDNKPLTDSIPVAVPFGHTNYVSSQENKPATRKRVMVSDEVTDEEVYARRYPQLPAQPTSQYATSSRHRSFDDSYHEKDQYEENDEYCGSGVVSDRLVDYRTNSESESCNYSRDNSEPGRWTTGGIMIGSSDSNSEESDRNSELSEQSCGRYKDVSQRGELSIGVTSDNRYAATSKGVRPKLPPDSNNSSDMSTGFKPNHTSSMSELSLNTGAGPEHQNTRDVRPKVPRGENERNTEVAPTTGIRPKPNHESSPLTKQGDNGLPTTWTPMHDDDLVIDVPLDTVCPEYQHISSLFMKGTDNSFTITGIIRIQNPTFYLKVDLHKKFMEKKNKRGVTKMLWHGTKKELLETIKTNGFNRSYCGQNATYFGKGVYFARDVEYACRDTYSQPDPDGYKYVYYCKVLIGEFTQGTENMIDAPAKDPDVPHIKYDSVVNDMDDPKTHVIFSDTQAYPEYLVKFR